jgi:hypothetical protein
VIRAVTSGKDGPVIILGITEENVRRLKQGRPIAVKLGELLKMAVDQTGDIQEGELTLAITWGRTHSDVVNELVAAGVTLPADALSDAEAIDETL